MLIRFHTVRRPKSGMSTSESISSTVEPTSDHVNSSGSLNYFASYAVRDPTLDVEENRANEGTDTTAEDEEGANTAAPEAAAGGNQEDEPTAN